MERKDNYDTGERLKLRQIDKRESYVSKNLLLTCKKRFKNKGKYTFHNAEVWRYCQTITILSNIHTSR